MKHLILTLALLSAPLVARADELVTAQAPPLLASAAKLNLANVTPFITGLKEPQGLAREGNGDIIVCDYGAGEVLRYSATGAKKAVLASELKGPSQITSFDVSDRVTRKTTAVFLISERKSNRVIALDEKLGFVVLGDNIITEPLGLTRTASNNIYAVAHTTSKIYRLTGDDWISIYEAPGDEGRYGFRCLATDGDTLFLTDEVKGEVLMMSSGGRVAVFASGIEDPSGLAVRGDWVYVCDESGGGRLWKLDKNGVKTLAAQNLGRPRNVLFLDDKTALVSDRDGRVLKLTWPA